MSDLSTLATTALLGTGRQPPVWPTLEGPSGDLMAKVPREPVEKGLLQTAGVLGTCHLAGWLPPVLTPQLAPAPAEDASLKMVPPTLQQMLATVLADGPARLQAESFQRLAATGHAVPHRLLPKALDCGRRNVSLRDCLLKVIGQRGSWLATQNEAWAFAASSSAPVLDNDTWDHGSLDQRRAHLTALRRHDAGQSRELVATALQTEGARERTAWIECLATGLSMDDEDLLERMLGDKSKEARQAAMRLLSALPESRWVKRMIARLQPYVTVHKKLLLGTGVNVEAPEAYDAEWKADLIEEAVPKGMTMGQRAWWLLQMVRVVPLAWWESHTGKSPADLLEWAQKTDWKDALLQGWTAAQTVQRRVEWAEAFLLARLPATNSLDPLELLETLPMALREKHFLRLLDGAEPRSPSVLLDHFLASIPHEAPPLSEATGRELLRLLKQRINTGTARYDWQLRNSLVELACVMPATLFDACAQGWDITTEHAQPFAEAIARLGIVIDQRRALLTL